MWVLLAAVVLMSLAFGNDAVDLVTRGNKLTNAPVVDGVVSTSPAELARQASAALGRTISRDVYALARMLRSEAGSGSTLARKAVVHVAINDARNLGWSHEQLMVFANPGGGWAKGYFGPQFTPAKLVDGKQVREKAVRRYATSRDPFEVDVRLVEEVLAERQRGIDPTKGARKFVHIGSFGAQAGTGSYEALKEKWGADGWKPVTLAGTGDLVLFTKGQA